LFTLAPAVCLFGQYPRKGFDFQEACFRNPSLPYCNMRDFVIKPGKPSKYGTVGNGSAADTTVDAAGIDWRFADPAADALAVLDGSKLSGAAFARALIDRLAAKQGLTPEQAQNAFRILSGVKQVALSVHENAILMLVAGRPDGSILPALESGWKAVPLSGGALLIGHTAAVDQASKRLAVETEMTELPLAALSRPAGQSFWLAGSAKLAAPEALSAGVKRFELIASLEDRLASDTVFEFADVPDAAAIRPWLATLGNPTIDGPSVHAAAMLTAEDLPASFNQLAASPLGRQLSAIIAVARYLPARDTAETVHTRPVIFGLDGGPRETK
jgi:hypothetical protein